MYPTLASSILFRVCHVSDARGGCNVYPLLAFLFIAPSFSRPSSMFRSPSLSCFCNSSSPVIIPCQSATVRLRLRQCLHGIAIVFSLFHLRIPVVVRSPDLWLLSGFSVFSLVSVSVLCSVSRPCFSASSLPAQPGFLSASPFIPISAFLSSLSISGVLAAQPASSFLASVYSTVVPLSTAPFTSIDSRFPLSIAVPTVSQSLWPRVFRVPYPREFQKGNWRTSWLLPPFILVRLLLRFPVLFVGFVHFSSLRPPSSLSTTPSYVVLH